MNKHSLRTRLIALIIAPALFVGLILNILHISLRYGELKQQLIDTGNAILAPLAMISASPAPLNQQITRQQQLVNALYQSHSQLINNIGIFDKHNRLITQANPQKALHVLTTATVQNPHYWPIIHEHDTTLSLYWPIYLQQNHTASVLSLLPVTQQIQGYIAINLNLHIIQQKLYQESLISLILLFFCLGTALLLALRLLYDVTQPINNMVKTVSQLSQGELSARANGEMPGELNSLKEGINTMAGELENNCQKMQDHINQATAELLQSLTTVEQQNLALTQAKQHAQEALRVKAEFLANMSHELRTPLNGVIGFTRQTMKTDLTHVQRDYLQIIDRSATHLLSIINDVLDFSKLEAGKLTLEEIPFSLRTLLDDVIVLLSQTAHEKGLELTLWIQHDLADQFIGDPLRLKQILINLINNAIKFTVQGNVDIIVVKRYQLNPQSPLVVEFLVRDTGIGISEQQQSQLFQAFRQADATISRQHGGTGLGLVICKKLLEQMGGTISFHSKPHKGSTFWFNLNLQPETPCREPAPTLAIRHLAYIEANPAAADATLELGKTLSIEIQQLNQITELTDSHYDALLLGLPARLTAQQQEHIIDTLLTAQAYSLPLVIAAPNSVYLSLTQQTSLPKHEYINKPVSLHRLIPLLKQAKAIPSLSGQPLALAIMIVDDNTANLKLLSAMLHDRVKQLFVCQSGQQAIDCAWQQKNIDLILMDIQMPTLDGLHTTQSIRQIPYHQTTPIIAVTAYKIDECQQELKEAGINDYLIKPINEQQLTQMLLHYCPSSFSIMNKVAETLSPAKSFDWKKAVDACLGKTDLAQELVSLLLAEFPATKNKVQQALLTQGKNDKCLLDTLHKLQGSCHYCGTRPLADLSLHLEKQLRNGTSSTLLEPELLELLDEIDKITQQVREQYPLINPSSQPLAINPKS